MNKQLQSKNNMILFFKKKIHQKLIKKNLSRWRCNFFWSFKIIFISNPPVFRLNLFSVILKGMLFCFVWITPAERDLWTIIMREYWYYTNGVKAKPRPHRMASFSRINCYKAEPAASITSGYNAPCKLSIPLLHLPFFFFFVASHELNRERSPSNTIHHLIDGHFWKSCQNKTRPSTPIPSEAMSFVGCQNEQKKVSRRWFFRTWKVDDRWMLQKNTQKRILVKIKENKYISPDWWTGT